MFRIRLLAAAVALGLAATPATAQDYNARPNYGVVTLASGFEPDPHVTDIHAGGPVSARDISGECAGNISDAPDLRLDYSAGRFPLILSAAGDSDLTLVVNAPNGAWHCDDDSGQGTNPSIRFDSPASGHYDIWVGTYSSGTTPAARLHISEVSSQ